MDRLIEKLTQTWMHGFVSLRHWLNELEKVSRRISAYCMCLNVWFSCLRRYLQSIWSGTETWAGACIINTVPLPLELWNLVSLFFSKKKRKEIQFTVNLMMIMSDFQNEAGSAPAVCVGCSKHHKERKNKLWKSILGSLMASMLKVFLLAFGTAKPNAGGSSGPGRDDHH